MLPTKRDPVLEESVDVFARRLPPEIQAMIRSDRPTVRYAKEVSRARVLPDMESLLSAPIYPHVPGEVFSPTQTEDPEQPRDEPQTLLEG